MHFSLKFKHYSLKILYVITRNRSKSSSEYCLDIVKQYDYENFISTILLKNPARSNAIAIRSFNVEVSRIAEQVTQESTGLMRFKFWEDTLDKCFSDNIKVVPKHPVAFELFKAVNKSKLSKRYFNNLVLSRKNNLNLIGFNNLEELEKYSEQTISNIYYLILEGCGVKNVNADHAASHLGKAQGIVQQLRSIPQASRLNLVPIPQDILTNHHITQENVMRLTTGEQLKECVFEVATRAHQHAIKSKKLLKDVPIDGRNALLPLVTVLNYLEKLQRVDYDVFHPNLKKRDFFWFINLWLTSFKNKH